MSKPRLAYNQLKSLKSCSNPIIVNLHGFLGDKSMFHKLNRLIQKEIDTDIINVDLRNHGDSFISNEMDYTLMTQDLIHFIEAKFNNVELQNRGLNFIGFSMGAKIAMLSALKLCENDIIKKIVSIDMPPYFTPTLPKELIDNMKLINLINQGKIKINSGTKSWKNELVDKVGWYFASGFFKNKKNQIEGSHIKHYLPIEKFPTILNDLKEWPVISASMIQKCNNVDILFMKGKNSPLIQKNYSLLDKYFPNNKVIEFNTGHNVLFEEFDRASTTIINFLKT